MSRSRNDEGFATAIVIVLTTIFSASAILLLNASLMERKRVTVEIERAEIQASMEAAILWAATEISGSPEQRLTFVDTASETFFYNGISTTLELVHEGEKLDLNGADFTALDQVLSKIVSSDEFVGLIQKLSRRSVQPLKLVDDLWLETSLSGQSEACLRKHFTVFGGQLAELGELGPRPFERNVTAGRNFGLTAFARASSGYSMAISAIILITGIPEDPYWVLDWRYISSLENERCTIDAKT